MLRNLKSFTPYLRLCWPWFVLALILNLMHSTLATPFLRFYPLIFLPTTLVQLVFTEVNTPVIVSGPTTRKTVFRDLVLMTTLVNFITAALMIGVSSIVSSITLDTVINFGISIILGVALGAWGIVFSFENQKTGAALLSLLINACIFIAPFVGLLIYGVLRAIIDATNTFTFNETTIPLFMPFVKIYLPIAFLISIITATICTRKKISTFDF